MAQTEHLSGQLLVYADIEEGMIEACMFYCQTGRRFIRHQCCSDDLADLMYQLWLQWRKVPGNQAWRVMAFVVDGGQFGIDLIYPDQLAPDEDGAELWTPVVQKYLGKAPIDYSRP